MTGASRPSVRVGKRTLAAFAAGSIAVPLSFGLMGGTAFAAAQGSSTPPAPISIQGVCPTGQTPDSNFPDTQTDFFKDAINCLVAYGVTQGYPDGNYKPSLNVNREQMALFFYRVGKAAGMSWNTSDAGFKDINTASSQEAKDAINALANAKVINGFTDGTYRPAVVVQRDAMAKFIANTIKVLGGPDLTTSTNDYYTDDAGDIFENFINGITDGRISNGMGGHTYGVGQPVARDAMAGFISRSMEVLNEAGKLPSQFGNVVLNSTSVQQGGALTGTIQGTNASVSGCGLNNQALTDTDSNTSGTQFSVTIPTSQSAGDCTLTFTFTGTNGQQQTAQRTITVTAAPQGNGQTVLPELVSAKILSTQTSGTATTANPAGTTVQYVFDQDVHSAILNASGFHVFTAGATPVAPGGSTAGPNGGPSVYADPTNANAIDVLYPSVNTASAAAGLTLATVGGPQDTAPNAPGGTVTGPAVTTANGSNPDGSAAIGSSSTSTLTSGVTSAPDLTTVSAPRATATAGTIAVDFTFDQAAWTQQANGAGFDIVLASTGQEVACSGPAPASTAANTPGSSTVVGGNGTTVITVTCDNTTVTPATPAVALSSSTAIARGVVQPDTVGTQQIGTTVAGTTVIACTAPSNTNTTNGVCNPLEASNTPHTTAGSTPSITNVTFTFGTAGTTNPDSVTYTFDQPVTVVASTGGFKYYNSNGSEVYCKPSATPLTAAGSVTGTTASGATTCTINQSTDSTKVQVTFGHGDLAAAVGASVITGTVKNANTGAANADDEMGASNPNTSSIAPGAVNAPQLQSVKVTSTTSPLGVTTYSATYTFSTPLNTTVNAGSLHLYDADGTELTCNGSGATLSVGTTSANNTQVTCSSFVQVATGGSPATNTQLGNATLGTADYGAVKGGQTATNTNNNPEGAAAATH